MMKSRSTDARYSFVSLISSWITLPSRMRGKMVLRMAFGCSMISLNMKCSYPPFSAAEISQSTYEWIFSTGSRSAL